MCLANGGEIGPASQYVDWLEDLHGRSPNLWPRPHAFRMHLERQLVALAKEGSGSVKRVIRRTGHSRKPYSARVFQVNETGRLRGVSLMIESLFRSSDESHRKVILDEVLGALQRLEAA